MTCINVLKVWALGLGLITCCVCAAAAEERPPPRVALLFATRGPLPLEPAWAAFLDGIRDLQLPKLSDADWESVLETERIRELDQSLTSAGELTANRILQDAPCADNDLIRVCTPPLHSAVFPAHLRGA